MMRASIDASHFNERLDQARRGIPLVLSSTAGTLGRQLLEEVTAALPSGPLADSYEVTLRQEGDAVLAGLTSSLPYAGFYEFGFQGGEQVSEHLRQITEAFGRPVATPHEVLVRSHDRRVEAPGHGVAGQALRSMAPEIAEGFTQAILQELSP